MSQTIQILGAVAAGLVAVACSSGAAGDGATDADCPAYVVPTGTDLMTPAVTFKTQVVGTVFVNNCGTSSCHGVTPGMGGLFLGTSTADAPTVHAELVGKDSTELVSMPFVTAGDPEQSYLMHKMDGDQCQFNDQCVAPGCMSSMPYGATMALPVSYRDLVRRWIAQGAQDD